MSTRRDRAARVILDEAWADGECDVTAEAYRIADLVLAEADRIPDMSEFQDDERITEDLHQSEGTAGEAASSPIDGGAAAPLEEPPAPDAASVPAALPSVLPRPFLLVRKRDVTGLSGTGVVAHGCEWPGGTVSLRWATAHPSTVHWDNIDELKAVHGHGGETVVCWLRASLIPGEV